MTLFLVVFLAILLCAAPAARAQQAPSLGYMFPPGGQAGASVEVVLGGYDWTPDMQLFVHDRRIQLQIIEGPGPILVPEPPYWFGAKARRPPFALPREMHARLTIPADVAPGVVRWHAANANGASATGRFLVLPAPVSEASSVGDATLRGPLVEIRNREEPQQLPSLPVVVAGQIQKIEEVDRYRFIAERLGPVTCAVASRALGAELLTMLEVYDESGRLVADAADTAGEDVELTFFAEAGQTYEIRLFDLDFRGDRSLVYWLSVRESPRVVATVPAAGRRAETSEVQFIGYGVASGEARLESVVRQVAFPEDPAVDSFDYHLDTPYGSTPPFKLLISDHPELVESEVVGAKAGALPTVPPLAVTGVLEERFSADCYGVIGKKGDVWTIAVLADSIGSPLDVAVAVLDAEGEEVARADDSAGSTDAALQFTVPADGEYQVVISDLSGHSGRRDAIYRLVVEPAEPDFSLAVPEQLSAVIGGKIQCKIDVTRIAGFDAEIEISLEGLPAGVTAPEGLVIPTGQTSLAIELAVASDAAATAALVSVGGRAQSGEQTIRRRAAPLLVATIIKPPFTIDAEGKDDVTKWPRGTTFPAPVLIERDAGFDQEIVLEMSARQGRHRQGIRGPDVTVPAGVARFLYPVFLPEWLETTRTSRMVVNGVAQVRDPQGNLRYSLVRQKTRMGFLPTGALLKLTAEVAEFEAMPGKPIVIPVRIDRSTHLPEPVLLELRGEDSGESPFAAPSQTVATDQDAASLSVSWTSAEPMLGEHSLAIRATAMQQGMYPVITETTVVVRSPKERIATKPL